MQACELPEAANGVAAHDHRSFVMAGVLSPARMFVPGKSEVRGLLLGFPRSRYCQKWQEAQGGHRGGVRARTNRRCIFSFPLTDGQVAFRQVVRWRPTSRQVSPAPPVAPRRAISYRRGRPDHGSCKVCSFSFPDGGWMVASRDLRRGCRPLSRRSPHAMARRTVRRTVRVKTGTDQVAEPSSDRGHAVSPRAGAEAHHPPPCLILARRVPRTKSPADHLALHCEMLAHHVRAQLITPARHHHRPFGHHHVLLCQSRREVEALFDEQNREPS